MSAFSSTTDRRAVQRDLYQEVTDRIFATLRAGVIPWRRDWNATSDSPRNWDGRPYRGVNWLMLTTNPYAAPVYVTFNKARELGGQVRKGEKGHLVVFWKFFRSSGKEATTADGGKPGAGKIIPMLRHYYVFNVEQCDGLPALPAVASRPFEPIAECERIVADMPARPSIIEDGRGRCFYRKSDDSVHMTARTAFQSESGFYSTLFHELGHATGHTSRLDRATVMESSNFGTETYSREELVAELTAANLCAHTGISAPVVENQAAYIKGWLDVLQADNKALIWAAGKAARAADFILGINYEDDASETETQPATA